MTDEVPPQFDLSLPQQRRQYEKHKAALERIEREAEEQEARSANLVVKWKEERAAQCGTESGFHRHKREGTEVCEPCLEARRAANRRAQKRKYERRQKTEGITPRKLKPCGTTAAARRHHRKGEDLCDLCREAHRKDMRELNETRKRLRAEGKSLEQVTAAKRAERKEAERKRRIEDENLMECCGAPKDHPEPTSKYAKRHWQVKTKPCEPARLCRNLGDRRKWARDNPTEPRELEPCGTAAGFSRHKYHKEEPCQPCRDAHNIQSNIYKKAMRERDLAAAEAEAPPPDPERVECCGAPVDGEERSQKYVSRHRQAGTPPCRPAKQCRNAVDRKISKARKCANDVNERRRERRSA